MTRITIELPDEIAQSAEQAGLLSGETLASVVRELVRERATRDLQAVADAFAARPVTSDELTPQDIRLAIDAARRH
jgi:Arc/MetJ family transcription regulator